LAGSRLHALCVLCILTPVNVRGVGDQTAKVLVVDSNEPRRRAIREWLTAGGEAAVWTAHDRASAVALARDEQPQLAIVELGLHECDGPAVALQIVAVAPHGEAIFFAGPGTEGALAAARDLGLARVVSLADLHLTLARLLAPLAESVRLRRRLDEVERWLDDVAREPNDRAHPQRISLPEAERRYRETYVRSLLAETGNRREAARRAGVPYTTLCEIIRKLGIPPEAGERQSGTG
jgi:DNA-binding NtrC family response regulator